VTAERLPKSMLRDLEALERASAEFERKHGDEARKRWVALGAAEGPLAEQQLAVTSTVDATPAVWDTLAWEVACRVDLVEEARAALRSEEKTTR
jgi:hypothetical protein